MKRYFIFVFFTLMFPIFVYADTCDNSKIVISNVEKIESSGYVEEITSPEINNQSITTNLKLYDVGDSITYQFRVKNNSTDDYDLRKNISSDENVTYEIISDNNTIKSGEEKTIQLKVTYKNKVDESKYTNGKYVQNKEHNITIGDNILNPSTGLSSLIIILLISLILIIASSTYIKDRKKYLSLFIILSVPFIVNAACQYRIKINSYIEFKKVIPNDCRYDGELVPGAEYVNGQYTYHYMQEWNYDAILNQIHWIDILDNGWGVKLTDNNSPDPVTTDLCTSINSKPIVSMSGMFADSNTTSIDFSTFDTSNVINMTGMFANSLVTSLDLRNFDTKNITNMTGMFSNSHVTSLDLSNFDIRNVEDMYAIFEKSDTNKINISNWKFEKCNNLSELFANTNAQEIIMNNVDTSKVTSMYEMFSFSKALSLDISSFDMRKVENALFMFCNVNPNIITKGQHFVELSGMYECNK